MSYVAFSTRNHSLVLLSGSARHYAESVTREILRGALSDVRKDDGWLKLALPDSAHAELFKRHDPADAIAFWFSRHGLRENDDVSVYSRGDDKRHSPWSVLLNTAMVAGSDAIKFLARLHAQCEIHAWVDGQNRKWLAAIVREGVSAGILRKWNGNATYEWEEVADFLETDDSEPVVMHYSVSDSFPSWRLACRRVGWPLDEVSEHWWDELSPEQRWDCAMSELRKGDGQLEWKPENWHNYTFEGGVNIYRLRNHYFHPTDPIVQAGPFGGHSRTPEPTPRS